MANADKSFGFQLLKSEGKENRVRYYRKKANTAVYPGDVVELDADGVVSPTNGSGAILGVAMGYSAAASTDEIPVCDDPSAEFIVQCDGDFQLTNIGNNADTAASAANTTLKTSGHELSSSSMAVTATLQFKILGLYDRGTNAVGSYAIVRVKPNAHMFNAGVEGI